MPAGESCACNTTDASAPITPMPTPANVNMYVNDVPFGETRLSYGLAGGHFWRGMLQILFFLWLEALARSWAAKEAECAAAAVSLSKHRTPSSQGQSA